MFVEKYVDCIVKKSVHASGKQCSNNDEHIVQRNKEI